MGIYERCHLKSTNFALVFSISVISVGLVVM